jgi:hypothetical protein
MEYKSVDVRVLFGSGSASRQELAPWFLKFAWACGLHIKCGKRAMCNVAPNFMLPRMLLNGGSCSARAANKFAHASSVGHRRSAAERWR